MNPKLKQGWEDFGKELTPNNIKIAICCIIPLGLGLYAFSLWMKLINPLMVQYSSPTNPDEAILTICILISFIAPIWPLAMWPVYFGLWLGKVTKFFKGDKTRRLVFDDKEYFLRDMPQEERDIIKSALAKYKSKIQLRKEKKQFKESAL